MMRIHCVARGAGSRSSLALIAAVALLLAVPLSSAHAGVLQPEVSVVGGVGVPGTAVSVRVNLADDTGDAGVSLGVHLRFDDALLTFTPPVAGSCTIAERLRNTHSVAGRILQPGLVDVEVSVSGSPDPVPPLGNGEIVSCDFDIEVGAPIGATGIEIEAPLLGDDKGMAIPVRIKNGQVEIVAALPTATSTPQGTATVTPTHTNTEAPTNTPSTPSTPTQTATNTSGTQVPTPSSTATRTVTKTPEKPTATATSSPPPTSTRTGGIPTATNKGSGGGGGCSVTPNETGDVSGTFVLLLGSALLARARRRRT